MDVDDLARHFLAHLVRQDLHVAGQHDQFSASLLDQVHDPGFGLRLVGLGHRYMVEGNVVVDDDLLVVEVIGNDADDVDRQCADLPAVEKVVEAVAEARDHQQNLLALGSVKEVPVHAETFGDGHEALLDYCLDRAFLRDEGDAHEELASVEIVELRAVDNVATLLGEIPRNRRHDAAGRLAGYGQYVLHWHTPETTTRI